MDERWEELERRCQSCRECSLCETRTNVVFGTGSRTAELLLVGEGPGANEDAQGVPFVGKAGQLLDDMLAIISTSPFLTHCPCSRVILKSSRIRRIAAMRPRQTISFGRSSAVCSRR